MKRNINTIQNTDDTILANATERYIIEALANLGQRYSIKGDGISVRVNTLGKLIPEFDQDPTQYIVKVEKTNENSILFKLLHNDSILSGEAEASFSIDLDNGANIDSYSCIVNETDIKSFSKLYMYSTTWMNLRITMLRSDPKEYTLHGFHYVHSLDVPFIVCYLYFKKPPFSSALKIFKTLGFWVFFKNPNHMENLLEARISIKKRKVSFHLFCFSKTNQSAQIP